jgi:hypothetical protein
VQGIGIVELIDLEFNTDYTSINPDYETIHQNMYHQHISSYPRSVVYEYCEISSKEKVLRKSSGKSDLTCKVS